MKVLSLLPRSRFTESGMTLPETLSLHFLPPNGSHVLIAAAESAQALLLPPSQPYVDAFCLERMPSIRSRPRARALIPLTTSRRRSSVFRYRIRRT